MTYIKPPDELDFKLPPGHVVLKTDGKGFTSIYVNEDVSLMHALLLCAQATTELTAILVKRDESLRHIDLKQFREKL